MNTREERAAAMRQTWLGDAAGEAVAWDELKQCVRDRWLAVLDAAQPESTPVWVRFDVTAEEFAEKMSPIVGANVDIEIAANVLDLAAAHAVIDAPPGVPSVDDLTIIAWNEMRGLYPRMGLYDQANPLEQGTAKAVAAAIRDAVIASYAAAHGASVEAQPLSDEVIERMAKAARESLLPGVPEDDAYWPQWYDAIRAALAAVGPQYCPRRCGVQQPRAGVGTPDRRPAPPLSDARREVDEVRRHISVTMSRERQARKEAQEAKRESHDLRTQLARESEWVRQYKQDRDDALAELEVVKAERDEYLRMYENEQKNADHWKAKAALADAAVSELRDQIDDDNTNAAAVNDLLIKLQNVTAERDRLVDENKQVTIDYGIAVKSHNRQQEAHVACKNEVDRLVSQLAAVTAERDEARAEGGRNGSGQD